MAKMMIPDVWVKSLLDSPNYRSQVCRSHFQKFDKNRNHVLEWPELLALCEDLCVTLGLEAPAEAKLKVAFKRCDKTDDETLHEDEFDRFFQGFLKSVLPVLEEKQREENQAAYTAWFESPEGIAWAAEQAEKEKLAKERAMEEEARAQRQAEEEAPEILRKWLGAEQVDITHEALQEGISKCNEARLKASAHGDRSGSGMACEYFRSLEMTAYFDGQKLERMFKTLDFYVVQVFAEDDGTDVALTVVGLNGLELAAFSLGPETETAALLRARITTLLNIPPNKQLRVLMPRGSFLKDADPATQARELLGLDA